MEILKKLLSLILTLSISLTLSGCWNYRELDSLEIVAGYALDKDENGDYMLTVEFAMPTPKGTSNTPYILTSKGKTIFDAIRNIILEKGRRAYWNHTKVIIVSKEIAEEGMIPVIDVVFRNEELREDIYLIVSQEKTAREIFYRKLEESQGERRVLSFDIEEAFKNGKLVAKFPLVHFYNFAEELEKEGVCPMLPTIRIEKEEGNANIVLGGAALFKKDKVIGYLNEYEAQSIMFLKEKSIFAPMVVEVDDPLSEESNGRRRISFETLKIRSKVKPIVDNNKLLAQCNINMDLDVQDLVESEIEYLSKEGISILEEAAEDKVKKRIEEAIAKAYKGYSCDILGLGLKMKQQNPDMWKELKSSWDKMLKELETKIEVNVQIKGSGLYNKSIKVRE